MILKKLKTRIDKPIRVGLVGLGAMGKGIAWQVSRTPGMQLVFMSDLKSQNLYDTAKLIGLEPIEVKGTSVPEIETDQVIVSTECSALLQKNESLKVDVFVEATNSIASACEYCLAAIDRGQHIVLMNAEVDLVFGPLLQYEAKKKGLVVTSDAGDQHGVLVTMIDEIEMWGFEIVQAGNIKGFLDRYATPESIRKEAEKRQLDPVQCCAYTDGTKLNIEMALLSNGLDLPPFVDGMEGPRCEDVKEVLSLFDFDAYEGQGRVDYILGAEPGGGVYVVGRCDEEFQHRYLSYYKLIAKKPYYLFYRPYHLCHLETTRAIANAALYGDSILTPKAGWIANAYAYAKSDLKTGQRIQHGIGGTEAYGLIRSCSDAIPEDHLPIAHLEGDGDQLPVLKRDIAKDQPIRIRDVEFPDIALHRLLKRQSKISS